MTRKCSHCGHNGHNSRTCPNRGVKLFGVRLTDGASSSSSSSSSLIRKSASMGNLNLLHFASASASSPSSLHSHAAAAAAGCGVSAVPVENPEASLNGEGYLSDGLVHNSSSAVNARSERKKGVPWTEEEHRMFLIGLQKLGKGDWRGISRNYVPSRTPTQVASHAQKYFIRQNNLTRRKRRSSLFDITAEAAGPRSSGTSNSSRPIMLSPNNPVAAAPVTSAHSTSEQEEAESAQNSPINPMDTDSTAAIQETLAPAATASDASAAAACGYGPGEMVAPAAGMFQGFVAAASSPYLPFVFPVWASVRPSSASASASVSSTTVYRPTAVVPTAPIKIMDDCTGLSQLSLAENNSISSSATSPVGPPPPSHPPPPPCWPAMEPSELSLKLHDSSSTRQSAFQAADKTSFGSTTNVISVV